MYITRLASKEIFTPSNKIHREVGRAKDLSALLYNGSSGNRLLEYEGHGSGSLWSLLAEFGISGV